MRLNLVLFAAATTLVGCQPSPSSIEFILPDAYRGIFTISETKGGRDMVLRDGKFIITIPPTGAAEVNAVRPLQRVKANTALSYSGKVIECQPIEDLILTNSFDQTPRVYALGVDTRKTYYFFIGTEAQAHEIQKNPVGIKPGFVPPRPKERINGQTK